MKRSFVITLTTIILLCVFSGIVMADRLILIPEGTTLGTAGIKAEYLNKFDGDGQAIIANVGISKIEIEGARFNDFNNDETDVISAQLSIIPETSFTPAIALGVRDIGDESTEENSLYGGRSFYLAVSKKIPVTGGIPILFEDVSLHGGLGTDSLKGLFFGIEGKLPMGLHISGEYDSDDINVALAYKILPVLKVDVASIKGDMYYGAKFSTKF